MIYAFDIDGVIGITDGTDYVNSKPNRTVIRKVNELYDQGHTIKIFTGRGSFSGIDWYEFTKDQLSGWGVKYHELLTNKPLYDVLIDDRAIPPQQFLSYEKQTGTTVAVSGGFDPLHVGHVRNIREASKLGDRLIIILTRDDQLVAKKGYVFMPYKERKEILEAVAGVDEVVPNVDRTIKCYESLKEYRPNVFAKGGDRTPENMVREEVKVCREIGCKIVYGVGGEKVQSSSWLVSKWKQR